MAKVDRRHKVTLRQCSRSRPLQSITPVLVVACYSVVQFGGCVGNFCGKLAQRSHSVFGRSCVVECKTTAPGPRYVLASKTKNLQKRRQYAHSYDNNKYKLHRYTDNMQIPITITNTSCTDTQIHRYIYTGDMHIPMTIKNTSCTDTQTICRFLSL